jgi:hypothetical protein
MKIQNLLGLCGGVIALLTYDPAHAEGAREPWPLTGSFMQLSGGMNALSDEALERKLGSLKQTGADTIVTQWSRVDDQNFFSESSDAPAANLLGRVLAAAEKQGLKVYVGLPYDSAWFARWAWSDIDYLARSVDETARVVPLIWQRYGARKSFAGWYIPQEFSDWDFHSLRVSLPAPVAAPVVSAGSGISSATDDSVSEGRAASSPDVTASGGSVPNASSAPIAGSKLQDAGPRLSYSNMPIYNLNYFLRRMVEICKGSAPQLPVAFSSFFSARYTPQYVEYAYRELLRDTGIDILMVQDGRGARLWWDYAQNIPPYVQAFRSAAAANHAVVWSIVETFDIHEHTTGFSPLGQLNVAQSFTPASYAQILEAAKVQQPLVQKLIQFDFFYYMDPEQGAAQKALYEQVTGTR